MTHVVPSPVPRTPIVDATPQTSRDRRTRRALAAFAQLVYRTFNRHARRIRELELRLDELRVRVDELDELRSRR